MLYCTVSAIALGIPPSYASNLPTIINAAGIFGRVSSGYISDKFGQRKFCFEVSRLILSEGCITVMAPLTAITAISVLAWPFANTVTSMTVVCVVYGRVFLCAFRISRLQRSRFGSATFMGLQSAPLIHMGGTGDVGRRSGMAYTVTAFAILADAPIGGAIIKASGSYRFAGVSAGAMLFISVGLMWYTRYLMTGLVFRGKF